MDSELPVTPMGVVANPVRVDPTGTTVQPVSFSGDITFSNTSIQVSNFPSSYPVTGAFYPYSLGQQLAANSVPVVLTTLQLTALTPPAVFSGVVTNIGVFATQDSNLSPCISGSKVAVSGTFFQTIQPVSGTFWQQTQPVSIASTVNVNLLSDDGTALSTSNFGTAPPVGGSPAGAQALAVNACNFQGISPVGAANPLYIQGAVTVASTTVTNFPASQIVTLASTTITGTVAVSGTFFPAIQPVSISSDDGTALTTSGFGTAPPPAGSPAGSQALAVNASIFSGTTAVSSSNPLITGSQYNSVAPAPNSGQTLARQCDSYGNVFVNNLRRSQTMPVSGTVTSAVVTTLLVGQGAGVYTDLATVYLSIRESNLVNVFFGIVISDGTKNYRFNAFSQDVTTFVPYAIPPASFDPPLPSTNSNTAWTITLSSNSAQGSPPVADAVTVDYVCTFVKQGAE